MGVFTVAKRKARGDYDYNVREPLPIGHWLTMTAILLVALAIRYWFNFIAPHINAYGSCDACEYLRNAGALFEVVKLPTSFWPDAFNALTGHASPDVVARIKTDLAPLKDFGISGPIFPIFLAWSYVMAASPFNIESWSAPVMAQSLISALTCLFIGLTAGRAYGKPTGYVAGLLAALYPAFIVNSGRLYSETFAAFLLSVLCYVTVKNFSEETDAVGFMQSSFIAGFTAACLQFTRSVMFLLTLALLPITVLQQGWKKGIAGLLTFGIGFAAVALPWLATQKLAFGTATLVVDRVGHYNFFIGNNTDTLGWLSVPYPDGRGIEDKSLPNLAQEAYKKSPSHWLSLQLDKPMRLFQFPWNDFRAPIGPISFRTQVIWHQAMLLLACIGASLGFVASGGGREEDDYEYDRRNRGSQPNNASKVFLFFVFLLHSVYLFFITVPRYNLTAMVPMMIFAAAGITSLVVLLRANKGFTAATAIIFGSFFLMIVSRLPIVNVGATLYGAHYAIIGLILGKIFTSICVVALAASLWMGISSLTFREFGKHPAGRGWAHTTVILLTLLVLPMFALQPNASGRWYEWRCPLLTPGQTVSQTFTLPTDFNNQIRGRQLYLMVDADSAAQLSNLTLSIDGTQIDSAPIPAIAFVEEFERYQQTRHGQMREIEWVWNSLTEAAGVHNSDMRQWFLYPIPNKYLIGQSQVKVQLKQNGTNITNLYGAYPTSSKSVLIPSLDKYSWEKAFYGVENENGFSDTRYNTRITSLAATSYDMDLSPEPGVQSGRYNIHLLAGPPVGTNNTLYTVEETPTVDQAQAIATREIAPQTLPDSQRSKSVTIGDLPPYGSNDLWVVRISGDVRRSTGTATLDTELKAMANDETRKYASPWQTNAPCSTDWSRFDFSVPLQPSALPQAPDKLQLVFNVANPAIKTAEGLRVEGFTELKNVSMQIIRLPVNPLHPGNVIY